MKKITSLILALSIMFGASSASLAADVNLNNFTKERTYSADQFYDVSYEAWYYNGVVSAYEFGLMNGNSNTTFNPNGDVTIAETIALACRLNQIYLATNYDFTPTSTWFQPYIDFAVSNNIISSNEFSDYTIPANRGEFAEILVRALPISAFESINDIEYGVIPDINSNDSYYESVYILYRAGILTGNDTNGTYTPNSKITRSAIATLVARIADTSARQQFTLINTEEKIEVKDTITYEEVVEASNFIQRNFNLALYEFDRTFSYIEGAIKSRDITTMINYVSKIYDSLINQLCYLTEATTLAKEMSSYDSEYQWFFNNIPRITDDIIQDIKDLLSDHPLKDYTDRMTGLDLLSDVLEVTEGILSQYKYFSSVLAVRP